MAINDPPDATVSAGKADGVAPSPVPSLRADATPEEKDLHWFRHCYQRDKQKQLTLRAVLMGGVLGLFMAMSNLYTTLKLGWSFGVVVTACVLSFVIWNAFRILSRGRLSQMSLLENNCMASTASAAGYSTGATVGTAVGALLLVQGQHLPWPALAGWVFFSAGLGVFFAIPMKRQMINHEQLPFPTGTAAAETLRSLYSHGKEALHKAYGLLAALGLGLGVGWLRTYGTFVEQLARTRWKQPWLERLSAWLHMPEEISFDGFLNPLASGHMAGLALEPSLLLIGAGMIIGMRVCLSMLAGGVLLYYVVAPAMLAHDAAQAGSPGYVPAFTVSRAGNFNPVRWGLWGGTSLLVFASLTTLALDWKTVARAFTSFRFIGIFFGVIAIVPGWYLMVPNKEALERFNPPAANMWKAVADLLTQGIRMLPESAVWLIVIGSLIGVLLPVCERLVPQSRRWLPSSMGLGLSWVIVFQNSLSFALGATLVWLWTKLNRRNADTFSVPVASGFIAGESLIAAFVAIACTLVGILASR